MDNYDRNYRQLNRNKLWLIHILLLLLCYRMLNNNKLTTLGKEMLNGFSHLRTLKLVDNPLSCDCHLAWLSRHLKSYPRLGQHTKCASPIHLKDRNIADVQVRLNKLLFLSNIFNLTYKRNDQYFILLFICHVLFTIEFN